MEDCFRSCYENINCMYNEYENGNCSLFKSGDEQHSFGEEAFVIGRDHIDESCERQVVLDKSRLSSPSTTTEVNLQTSSVDSTGTETQTIPESELIGWNYFNGTNMCYKEFLNESVFDEAEAICRGYGGHLASIHSAEQDNFLFAMKKSKLSTTIGLKFGGGCEVDSRTKHWVDGSAVDYESWHSNQPDNWKCNENCGAKNWVGNWNDVMCDDKYPFFCQTENTLYCSQHLA
ncbi:hypothetical protein RB195_015134 [Necator americanus]|uniref:C-type lectin domain-containing protein n=1 Tax=Necator americanus TaxID=51031 RepID=A0ABR1E3P2_NECAM